jgi:hypothetical protein
LKNPLKIFVLVLFSLFGIIGLFHHEIWLDEAHHFVLARDSKTLSDLYFNNRYEGHPLLWNFLLWCLCKILPYVFAMQMLHLALSIGTVTLILWYTPFKFYQKILLSFSYFIFYEYTIISRNYALSLFLIFICIAQITGTKKNYGLIIVLLALLAQTHLFSLIISLIIMVYLLINNAHRIEFFKQHKIYFFVYLFAMLFAISFAKVPSDHFLLGYNNPPLLSIKRFGKAFGICWKSLFHFQPFNEFNLWNKNWLIEYSKTLGTIAAALSWSIPYILLKENKKVMIFFFCIAFFIGVFVFVSPLILAVRHSGFLFIALVISYWLLCDTNNGQQIKRSEIVFSIILLQLCLASIVMYVHDFKYPFSSALKTSNYILKINPLNETPIICQNTAMPVLSSYTGNKYIEINTLKEGSFCHWNNQPFLLNSLQVDQKLITYFQKQKTKKLLYITQIQLNLDLISNSLLNYSLIKSFENSIVKQENYFVYMVEKSNLKAKFPLVGCCPK